MPTADTPAVARQRVRGALRRARETRQLTQGQVADAMEWSLSKIMRIEKGEVNISPADLRMLLGYFEITDPVEVKRLMDDARIARKTRSPTDTAYREHLPSALLQLMQFEQEAIAIRHYASVIMPGILQTAAYAEAVFATFAEDFDEATVRTRIEARLSRREQVLYRPDPPEYLLILDESVLYRKIGRAAVMGEQLNQLLAMMRETPLSVRVVPFDAPTSIAILGPFTLVDLGDESSVLYRESFKDDEIVHSARLIERHRTVFDQMWSTSLGDAESAERVRQRAAELLAQPEDG